MLNEIDFHRIMEKQEFKNVIGGLEIRLGQLQRKARELGVPVIIVFEGWDAAGKGTLINNLILNLDPRGCKVYPTNAPDKEELLKPFLWRFWVNTPKKGQIVIFDRSWYGKVLVERVDNIAKKKDWKRAFDEINTFEKQLVDDGCIIIKFFLHISQKEQKKRFKKLKNNPSTKWKVTKQDLKHHQQYNEYFKATNDMLEKTHMDYAPWTIVESFDERYATHKIFEIFIQRLNAAIEEKEKFVEKVKNQPIERFVNPEESFLAKTDLSLSLEKDEYKDLLDKYQNKIYELEHLIYTKRIPVLIMYEGWDAAGKGGNIKRLVSGLDPRGYTVIPFAAPNDVEASHHYLWRFWINIPKAGHIALFDRSWYGRVLVERVEGFCSDEEWQRAYDEINQTEKILSDSGMLIFKFWIHIDKETQLERFKSREKIPYKNWKITDEDYRNREKWNDYEIAVEDMLFKTSTGFAPWTVIPGNSKYYARIKVLETVINGIKKEL